MAPANSKAPSGEETLHRDGAKDAAGVAEGDLASRFWGRLRLFALRRLGEISAAEDVAQETLRRVGEAVREGRIHQPAALDAFVFQTARHICLQLHRSAGREARALSRASIGEAPEVVPRAPADALTALIAEEQRVAVRHALTCLAPNDTELLRLAYYDLMNAEQIAERLGTTVIAVRVRKHRALRRLADLLGTGVSNTGPASGTL
jgi:RNA polymerase sigma factor (sigma-70 family)